MDEGSLEGDQCRDSLKNNENHSRRILFSCQYQYLGTSEHEGRVLTLNYKVRFLFIIMPSTCFSCNGQTYLVFMRFSTASFVGRLFVRIIRSIDFVCQGAADCLCCFALYVRCSSLYLASARTSWRTQALSACNHGNCRLVIVELSITVYCY